MIKLKDILEIIKLNDVQLFDYDGNEIRILRKDSINLPVENIYTDECSPNTIIIKLGEE